MAGTFERWLKAHHATDDTAHDISHFRRVWHTSQRLMKDQGGDALVILTACYFHDIVSLPKNHPQRGRSSQLASAKAIAILREAFADFPAHHYAAIQHAIERTASARALRRLPLKRKLCRMPTGWRPSGRLAWRASLPCPARWGAALRPEDLCRCA
jgi:uncharacterized protein